MKGKPHEQQLMVHHKTLSLQRGIGFTISMPQSVSFLMEIYLNTDIKFYALFHGPPWKRSFFVSESHRTLHCDEQCGKEWSKKQNMLMTWHFDREKQVEWIGYLFQHLNMFIYLSIKGISTKYKQLFLIHLHMEEKRHSTHEYKIKMKGIMVVVESFSMYRCQN